MLPDLDKQTSAAMGVQMETLKEGDGVSFPEKGQKVGRLCTVTRVPKIP